MVHAAECGVVDDALRAVDVGCEAGEAVHRGAGFAAGVGDPFDVEDDAAVDVGGAGGDEDELDAPGHFAVAFDVESAVGFVAHGSDLAGVSVELGVAGPGPEQGSDDFAVGVQHPREVGMGPRAGTVRVEESEFAGLAGGEFAVQAGERGEDVGVGEVAVAGVEIVVAAHRRCGQPPGRVFGEPSADPVAQDAPHSGVGEFGFDLAGAADRR